MPKRRTKRTGTKWSQLVSKPDDPVVKPIAPQSQTAPKKTFDDEDDFDEDELDAEYYEDDGEEDDEDDFFDPRSEVVLCPCCGERMELDEIAEVANGLAKGLEFATWIDGRGVHVMILDAAMKARLVRSLTDEDRHAIRSSPMWKEVIRELGKAKAEQALKKIRGEVRPWQGAARN